MAEWPRILRPDSAHPQSLDPQRVAGQARLGDMRGKIPAQHEVRARLAGYALCSYGGWLCGQLIRMIS